MYVNELTLDYGPAGQAGIRALLGRAHERGLIPRAPVIEFIGQPAAS
jgi:predicted solute-binding protein